MKLVYLGNNQIWLTSLYPEDKQYVKLVKKYNREDYPFLDNQDIINTNSYLDIPSDYPGEIAVPVTYMRYYNPDQFEIVDKQSPKINGERIYWRIIIRRKQK